MLLTRNFIEQARTDQTWDIGNEVLYDLCSKYPEHRDASKVIAKVWLIGRSYAAAIERRRESTDENDSFYVKKVAPAIIRSDIDAWIKEAASHKTANEASLSIVLSTHSRVTQLFREISGLEKRSLASKYLHFHEPNLFYIYDTRVVEAMRKLTCVVGRATNGAGDADNEYRKFVEKCLRLQEYIKEEFQIELTPREIDKVLLAISMQTEISLPPRTKIPA